MDELSLQRLTWPEIEAAIKDGYTTAIVCAASSEQHGPHLPEATDELIGAATARRLAQSLGKALVAPVIRPGCSDHHMAFSGSLTISHELMMEILDAYADSLQRHGFERIVVFSSHGGNFGVLGRWAQERPKPGVVVLSDLDGFVQAMFAAIRDFGRDDDTLPHADVMETSMMLVEHPDLVHMDRAEKGFTGQVAVDDLIREGMRGITHNGIMGDPRGASAEMGEAVFAALAGYLASQVQARSPR